MLTRGEIISWIPLVPTTLDFHSVECWECAHPPLLGRPTSHIPEILLNNFNTRLGHRLGRLLGSLFPHVRPLCPAYRVLFVCFIYQPQ